MTTASLVSLTECLISDLAAGPGLNLAGGALGSGQTARIDTAITVARGYVPRFKPAGQAAGEFQVYVSGQNDQRTRIARNMQRAIWQVDFGITCQLPNRELATIDAALWVAEQIKSYQFNYGVNNFPATWMEEDVIVWPDRDGLAKSTTFFALWVGSFVGQIVQAGFSE